MHSFHPDRELMTVNVAVQDGGGVYDGRLTSYFACPKCDLPLRFMALFESGEACERAWQGVETSYSMSMEMVGQLIIGTTAGRAHGTRSRYEAYQYACQMEPYYGTQLDLLRHLWARFSQQYGEIDWSKVPPMPPLTGVLDMTQLEGVYLVEDRMDPGSRRMLVTMTSLLNDPTEAVAGEWDHGSEDWEKWNKRRENAPSKLLELVQLPRNTI